MKYFVELGDGRVYHIQAEDAQKLYENMEQLGANEEAVQDNVSFESGTRVELKKSNAKFLWGDDVMTDRELFSKTLAGKIYKKTAMSIKL